MDGLVHQFIMYFFLLYANLDRYLDENSAHFSPDAESLPIRRVMSMEWKRNYPIYL